MSRLPCKSNAAKERERLDRLCLAAAKTRKPHSASVPGRNRRYSESSRGEFADRSLRRATARRPVGFNGTSKTRRVVAEWLDAGLCSRSPRAGFLRGFSPALHVILNAFLLYPIHHETTGGGGENG